MADLALKSLEQVAKRYADDHKSIDSAMDAKITWAVDVYAAAEAAERFAFDHRISFMLQHPWVREALDIAEIAKHFHAEKFQNMLHQAKTGQVWDVSDAESKLQTILNATGPDEYKGVPLGDDLNFQESKLVVDVQSDINFNLELGSGLVLNSRFDGQQYVVKLGLPSFFFYFLACKAVPVNPGELGLAMLRYKTVDPELSDQLLVSKMSFAWNQNYDKQQNQQNMYICSCGGVTGGVFTTTIARTCSREEINKTYGSNVVFFRFD